MHALEPSQSPCFKAIIDAWYLSQAPTMQGPFSIEALGIPYISPWYSEASAFKQSMHLRRDLFLRGRLGARIAANVGLLSLDTLDRRQLPPRADSITY